MSDRLRKRTFKEKFSSYKVKYLVYGVAGGFYFSTILDRTTQRIWCSLAAIGSCALLGLEICLLFHTIVGNKDYTDTSSAIMLHNSNLGTCMCVLVACFHYYFQKEQEWALTQNEDRQESMEYLKERPDLKKMDRLMLYVFILCNISYLSLLIGHIFFALFTATDVEELKEAKYQLFPNPFTDLIETEVEFVSLTTGLFISFPILMYVAVCDALFGVAIAREYYLSQILLWISIECFSEESKNVFENLNERFLDMDKVSHTQLPDHFTRLDTEREHLAEKIKSAAQAHRRNIK